MNISKKTNIKEYLNKTRELLLLKYTTDIKKERALRLQESYSNEIESINDNIQSMKQAKKLFHEEFLSKYNEYVKQLLIQKEEEKLIAENLYDNILLLKKDIVQLEAKKNKVENDKLNLERWMYFQIKIHEQKISLPPYYKTSLDTKDPSFCTHNNEIFMTVFKKGMLNKYHRKKKRE